MTESDDLDETLDEIAWAHRIVDINEDTIVVFRPLSLKERNIANFIHSKALKEGKKSGILSREELTKRAIDIGIWGPTYTNDMNILKQEVTTIESEIQEEQSSNKGRRTPTSKLKKLQDRHEFVKNKVEKLSATYLHHIEIPSIEYQAENERAYYLVATSTLSFPEMERLWPTLQDLKEETRTGFVVNIINQYYKAGLATEEQIRKVARAAIWRIKWNASKKNGGAKTLFGREMYDITTDQFRLIYWSQIYDSAYESMEPPSDDVIDNDKLFDEWLLQRAEKSKQEAKKRDVDNKLSKASSNGSEVGIDVNGFYSEMCSCGVKDDPSKKGHYHAANCPHGVYVYYADEKKKSNIENIQSANPDDIRRILANEQKRLAESGDGIEEQHLRTDTKTRSMMGMSTKFSGGDKKRR